MHSAVKTTIIVECKNGSTNSTALDLLFDIIRLGKFAAQEPRKSGSATFCGITLRRTRAVEPKFYDAIRQQKVGKHSEESRESNEKGIRDDTIAIQFQKKANDLSGDGDVSNRSSKKEDFSKRWFPSSPKSPSPDLRCYICIIRYTFE